MAQSSAAHSTKRLCTCPTKDAFCQSISASSRPNQSNVHNAARCSCGKKYTPRATITSKHVNALLSCVLTYACTGE